MAEYTASDRLATKAVDFQAAAEAYYSIAVEKVKDVRYVAGYVSITRLAPHNWQKAAGCQAIKNTSLLCPNASLCLFTARI